MNDVIDDTTKVAAATMEVEPKNSPPLPSADENQSADSGEDIKNTSAMPTETTTPSAVATSDSMDSDIVDPNSDPGDFSNPNEETEPSLEDKVNMKSPEEEIVFGQDGGTATGNGNVDGTNGKSTATTADKILSEDSNPIDPTESINEANDAPETANISSDDTEVGKPAPTAPAAAKATIAAAESIANSKSAQLLMNRFSTWTQSANENAKELWKKQAPAINETRKNLFKQEWSPIPGNLRFTTALRGGQFKDSLVDGADENTSGVPPTTPLKASVSDANLADPASKSKASLDASFVSNSSVGDEEDEVSSSDSDGKSATDEDPLGSSGELPRVRAGFAYASTAAAVVAESVATNFRGRYKAGPIPATPPPKSAQKPADLSPESQTALILKSRAAKHMQEILDGLDKHEFAMLLGNGMLGVNLKQCYLKNHGVFIDFLVEGGQAQLSGVIRAGDLLLRIGDIDVRKGTIAEIPQTIANAKRPVVIILATGTKVAIERMNYIDIAVAMLHRARKRYDKRKILSPSKETAQNLEGPPRAETVEDLSAPKSVSSVSIPIDDSLDGFLTPPTPTLDARKEFADETAQRCNDKFVVSNLLQLADLDSNFRNAIRNAFLTCAIDNRKLPFLARYLSSGDELSPEGDAGNLTPSAQLMLFLELTAFFDLYGVTPVGRLRDIASRIAHKFFLPTKVGNRLQPPLFDFHQIVPDASLRHLEAVLGGKASKVPRDVFLDFERAVVDSLTGAPFLSFLTSTECSRMRAFQRNTAPYVNLPLRDLFDALVGEAKHAGAKNCFVYILIFLLCRVEKEPTGEHIFSGDDSPRLVGAASGLCCAVFIRRILLPSVLEAKKAMEGKETVDPVFLSAQQKIVSVSKKFWDFFVAGSLESFSKSSEAANCYRMVRSELERAATAASESSSSVTDINKAIKDILIEPKFSDEASRLADELLYDYAANVHTIFREHKFHEWMCNELCKMRGGDPTWSSKQELPHLPQGCVKRLLRNMDCPPGVSSHKPYRTESKNSNALIDRKYPNADYAIVFGTSVGADLASQMPIPAIETSGIRRYICASVALDRDGEFDSLQAEEMIPATLESYAVVPQAKPKPLANDTRSR